MSSGASASPSDDYFNDLSRGISNAPGRPSDSPQEGAQPHHDTTPGEDGTAVPRPKRIACVVCRRRKLRCDGAKPSCGTCSRLGHDCAYDEVRRKSGPKRGYVKALEARLAQVVSQVETLVATQGPPDVNPTEPMPAFSDTAHPSLVSQPSFGEGVNFTMGTGDGMSELLQPPEGYDSMGQAPLGPIPYEPNLGGNEFSWEMIGLGIDEPLPSQEVIDELHQTYFDKIHSSIPMIHRQRYLAAMDLGPTMRPPVCLRYAIWCSAASVMDKYMNLQELFYQRARKYIEMDEMKGHGEQIITIAHSQCWTLIANYEFKLMYFPRAWVSVGRGIRLAQMLGLHRLDGSGLDVKQCLPAPRDWTEKEERRRTFWMAFCEDRYASIGTGWPMTIEEKDISTNLPASEEAFESNIAQRTLTLKDAMTPAGAASLSACAGVVLMACLFGRNLVHLHRPDPDENEDDLNGEFWKRHRQMDAVLSNTSLSLPSHLKLPSGINNPNIIFLNMNIHTSTICLHQAAIFKADKNRLAPSVSAESKIRCITAAAEIASIMRSISHMDLATMNPFISFCLYVAARVFVQYLKSRGEDEQVKASLIFLLSAMRALKRQNPLTESFLVQLDVDLEGTGLDDPAQNSRFPYGLKKGVAEIRTPKMRFPNITQCRSPVVDIGESQSQPQDDSAGSISSNPNPAVGGGTFDPSISSPENGNLSCAPGYMNTTLLGPEGPVNQGSVNLPRRQKPHGFGSGSFGASAGCYNVPGADTQANSNIFANVLSSNHNEMDLSPDTSSSGAANRPSPSNSTQSNRAPSSQTSYTPPSYEDVNAQNQAHKAQSSYRSNSFYAAHPEYSTTSGPPQNQFMPPTPIEEAEGPYMMGSGWDLGGTGMTPGADGMFTQILETGWDESTMSGTVGNGRS
ncbi:MAG: hypothetical protein M1817_001660 [Caeruleum heppii]|nr:MAG: hypothetical protein M1817_001660 [Caeruleum heppii]